MYGNVKRSGIQPTQVVPLDAVQQIVQNITNPIKKEKLIQGDGGAYRAYCFNILGKK